MHLEPGAGRYNALRVRDINNAIASFSWPQGLKVPPLKQQAATAAGHSGRPAQNRHDDRSYGRSRKRGKRRSQKDSASANETELDSDKESSSEGSQLEAEGERERQGRPVTEQHGGKQRQQEQDQPQRHRVPSVPGGTRISVYWTEEPAGWFQATVVRSRKGSETNPFQIVG
eukprot:scaffold2419_cov114-Isochrysis_galbana.AAC.1